MNFGEDSKLASCGDTVRIWSLPNFKLQHEFSPTSAPYFRGVSWSPDGNVLVSVPAYGNTVTVTNLSAKKNVYNTAINIPENVCCAKFNTNSNSLLVGCSNGSIILWNVVQEKRVRTFTGHISEVNCMQCNVTNTHVASGSGTGEIIVHNLASGMYGAKLIAGDGKSIRNLRFATVKKALLASCSDSGKVHIWDINTKQIVYSYADAHDAPSTGVIFSPINSLLFMSVGLDKKLKIYNLNTKSVVKTFLNSHPVQSLEMLDDGHTVLIGSSQGHIIVYDLRLGRVPIKTFLAHVGSVRSLALKKFRSKSERSIKPETGNIERSASSSETFHYHDSGYQAIADTPFLSPENNVFSPVRQVPEIKVLEGEITDLKSPSYSSNNSASLDEATVVCSAKKSNVPSSYALFSPPREDEINSSSPYPSSIDITPPMDDLSSLKRMSLVSENNAFVEDLTVLPEVGLDGISEKESIDPFGMPRLTDIVNRWQTRLHNDLPNIFTHDLEPFVLGNSPVNSDTNVSTKRLSLVSEASIPKYVVEDDLPDTPSNHIDAGTSPLQRKEQKPSPTTAHVFQTEFLSQLFDDKLEDFRVKTQQQYFNVFAQLIKQHLEMKEEFKVLKESLNFQAELQEELKRLRAENRQLRTFF